MSVDNNHTTSTTHDDRLAVRLGLGAVLLWSTVATAFSLSLEYWTPLQLVTIAASVSWCLFAFRLTSSTRRAALHATLFKDRLAALAVGWMNPGLYYLVLFAAYDRLPAQEAMAINYSWGITLALIAHHCWDLRLLWPHSRPRPSATPALLSSQRMVRLCRWSWRNRLAWVWHSSAR